MAGKRDRVVDITQWQQKSRRQLLEKLFNEHRVALRRFLRVRFGSDVESDDLIQDVFVWLAKKDDLFKALSPESGSNRSFLLTVLNNMAVDMERRKVVRRRYVAERKEEVAQEVGELTPERVAGDREHLKRVHEIIMNLRPSWRRVFVMNRFESMSYRQIASTMGISVKQVEKYMSSALREIRKATQQLTTPSRGSGS